VENITEVNTILANVTYAGKVWIRTMHIIMSM
jgi:hypothetical protein